jgi:hypothetical protein
LDKHSGAGLGYGQRSRLRGLRKGKFPTPRRFPSVQTSSGVSSDSIRNDWRPTSLDTALEHTAGHRAQEAQRPGVFEAFGGFFELLQKQFDVSQRAVVLDKLADAALSSQS